MKKFLLCATLGASLLLVYSTVQAQSNTQVQIGQLNGTVNGLPVGYNGQTGVVQLSNGKGGGIIFNSNTGAYQAGGTIGGVRFNVSDNGTSVGGANGLSGASGGGLLGLLALAQLIVARLVPFLIGLAAVVFFWFLIQFIWKGNESGDVQKKSLSGMAYSVLAMFVMVSIWGIIGFFGSVLGIRQGGTIPNTCLPGETSC